MGSSKKKKSPSSSDDSNALKQKWEMIFKTLKQMLQNQAQRLDLLVQERQLLHQRIHLQCQRWNSDVCLLQDVIAQKKRLLSLSELEKLVQVSKANFLLGSKQRDQLVTKLKLECSCSELSDFKAWFDILSHRCPDEEDISPDRLYENLNAKRGTCSSSKETSKHHSELEKVVASLKHEYEKLSLKHKSDLAALHDENTFVWKQFKLMEANYTNQLNTKNDEVNQANEKVTNLLESMEKLQSESVEKDETVATLRANNTRLEAELNKKDGDISRLSKQIEMLKSKSTDSVPLSNHCSPELPSSGLKGRRNGRKKVSSVVEEDATYVQQQDSILTLRSKVSELESERNQKGEEISRLSKELKLLRSKTSVDSSVLKHCTSEPYSSKLRDRGNRKNGVTASVEQEASFMQSEATIATLNVRISELEAQANKKNEEISALSEELKLLKSKSKSIADTPILRHCTNRPSSSRSKGRKDGGDRDGASLKEEISASQLVSKQGGKRSKRKRDDVVSIEDTPRLFTSQFKIPKLRIQSPVGR